MNAILDKLIDIYPANKVLLRKLAPEGFSYQGYWNGLYHFSKEIKPGNWVDLRATDEDLINGNLDTMSKSVYLIK